MIDNALRDLQSMREIQEVTATASVDTQPPQATSEPEETDVQEQRLEANINREEQPSNTSSINGGMVNIGNEFLTHSSTISIRIHGLGNEGYFIYLSIPPVRLIMVVQVMSLMPMQVGFLAKSRSQLKTVILISLKI